MTDLDVKLWRWMALALCAAIAGTCVLARAVGVTAEGTDPTLKGAEHGNG